MGEGRGREARQALNAGAAEALGRVIPGYWESVAPGGMGGGGVSLPEGSPECLEVWWPLNRHRKGAWTASLGREGRLRKLVFFLEY